MKSFSDETEVTSPSESMFSQIIWYLSLVMDTFLRGKYDYSDDTGFAISGVEWVPNDAVSNSTIIKIVKGDVEDDAVQIDW